MGEIRIVGPGKTRGYPYPVCKKMPSLQLHISHLDRLPILRTLQNSADQFRRRNTRRQIGSYTVWLQDFVCKIQHTCEYIPQSPKTTNALIQMTRMDKSTGQKKDHNQLLQLCTVRTVWSDPGIRPDSVRFGKFTILMVTN